MIDKDRPLGDGYFDFRAEVKVPAPVMGYGMARKYGIRDLVFPYVNFTRMEEIEIREYFRAEFERLGDRIALKIIEEMKEIA